MDAISVDDLAVDRLFADDLSIRCAEHSMLHEQLNYLLTLSGDFSGPGEQNVDRKCRLQRGSLPWLRADAT